MEKYRRPGSSTMCVLVQRFLHRSRLAVTPSCVGGYDHLGRPLAARRLKQIPSGSRGASAFARRIRGGGYGSPYERAPERVLKDVERRWETIERARDIYGVVLTGNLDDDDLAIDGEATEAARSGA